MDLHFLREERQAELAQDTVLEAAARKSARAGARPRDAADLTVVVSPIEKQILQRECPGIEVMVIPTIYPVDPAEPPGFDEREDIVFIGGFAHAPNVDAVLYFAQRDPASVLRATSRGRVQGDRSRAAPGDRQLESPQIQVLGYVPDVKPIFDRARVSVAPLRFGAGVKGKVNHSMALGVPAVVTSLAAEGMYLEHEQNAMIADDPQSFADAVVRVGNRGTSGSACRATGSAISVTISRWRPAEPADRRAARWAGLYRLRPGHPVRAANGG